MATGKRVQNPFEVALAQEGITGVAADVARSIYTQESSNGTNTKTSNAGAVGGMQMLPSTFKSMADKGWDINDPVHNARAGIRFVNHLHGKSNGDPALTAVGYYGGPGAMNKARNGEAVSDPRNPNAPDTFRYADEVLNRMPNNQSYNRLVRAGAGSVPAVSPVSPVLTAAPVMGAPSELVIPDNIPAYRGVPDQWSNFGRALPKPAVQARDLGFDQIDVGQPPMIQPINTGIFSKIISAANTPIQANFKKWGKP